MHDQQNPYAATQVALDLPPPGELPELAGRGARLMAVMIDGLIMAGSIGLFSAMMIPAFSRSGGTAGIMLLSILIIVAWLALLIYNLVLIHRHGQTLGKRFLGIKVVRSDGSRCSLRRYIFMRHLLTSLLGAIPFVGPFINLIGLLLIFRASRKCLHDEIADTLVVKA